MITTEMVLAEAEKALAELPKAHKHGHAPLPDNERGAAATIEQIAALLKQNESLPVYGLGTDNGLARLWRVIAAMALNQAAICTFAAARRANK